MHNVKVIKFLLIEIHGNFFQNDNEIFKLLSEILKIELLFVSKNY